MFPRMGTYELQPMMHAGRPVYAYRSPEFGVAYMYYGNLSPTEQYWIVGTSVGSRDANFGAADSSARSPDLVRHPRHFHSSSRLTAVPLQISAVWRVTDSKKPTFDAAPNVHAECADGTVATSKILVNLGFGAAFFAVGAVTYKQIVGKSATAPGVDAGPGRYAKVTVVPENV